MRIPGGFQIDNPAFPVLQAVESYAGVADTNGNALGTTVIDAGLASEPSYVGMILKVLSGDAAGQTRAIVAQVGATVLVAPGFTDVAGAAEPIDAGTFFVIISTGSGGGSPSPAVLAAMPSLPFLAETWQDVLGIPFTVWTTVLTNTGAATRLVTEEPYQKVQLTGPANADTARLRTVQQWSSGPLTWGLNTIQKRLIIEWEAKYATIASIDNALHLMGMGNLALSTRASVGIMGFILTAGVLNCITKDAVGELVQAVGAPVLTTWHKYKIEVIAQTVIFSIDEAIVATAVGAAQRVPNFNMFGQFFLPQGAAANGAQLNIGPVSIKALPFI